jgi:hypothetical protein
VSADDVHAGPNSEEDIGKVGLTAGTVRRQRQLSLGDVLERDAGLHGLNRQGGTS